MEFFLSSASATRSGAASAFFTSSSPFPLNFFLTPLLYLPDHAIPRNTTPIQTRNTSTMSNPQIPIPLRTNIRKVLNHNLDVEAGVLRFRSISSKPKAMGKGAFTLTATEEKAVHRELLRKYVSDENLAVKLDNHDLLAKKPHDYAKDRVIQYLAVVTFYEGKDKPPKNLTDLDYNSTFTGLEDKASANENGDILMGGTDKVVPPKFKFEEYASFKQFISSTGDPSSPRRRLFRIHATECDDYQVRHSKVSDIFSIDNIGFLAIPMKLHVSTLSVREAFNLAISVNGNDPAVGMNLNQFFSLSADVDDLEDVLCKEQDERSDRRDFPDVCTVTEPSFRAHLNHKNDLVLSEKSHTSVFKRSGDKTLTDYIKKDLHADLLGLNPFDYIEMLTTKLSGVQVQIDTSGGSESCEVVSFTSGTSLALVPSQRHHAWPSEDHQILSTNLPLVNVGTIESPLYLPTEMCHMLNKWHGEVDVVLQRHISSKDRANAMGDLPEACEVVEGNIVFHQLADTRAVEQIQQLVEVCGHNFPNLLFVEAGSAPVDNSSWTNLRNALIISLLESFKRFAEASGKSTLNVSPAQRGDAMPLLHLQSASEPGSTKDWTKQLCGFVTANPGPKQKTIIVVLLGAEKDGNAMYKAIKKACDLDAGSQTVFIKRGTLEGATHGANRIRDPVKYAVEDIRRRIRQKNPRMMTAARHEEKSKTIISMHVSKVLDTSGSAAQGQQDCSEMFLVTLVSRDHSASEQYHTERGLYSKSALEKGAHAVLLQPFLKLMPIVVPGNIIIVRSGCMPFPKEDTAQHAKVAYEIENLKKVFPKQSSAPGVFTYVALTEDSTLSTRMGAEAYRVHRPSAKLPAILFTKDDLLIKSGERSIKVQQAPRVRSYALDGRAPEIRRGAITATFYRSNEGVQELNKSTIRSSASPSMRVAKSGSRPRPNRDAQGNLLAMRRSRPLASRSGLSALSDKLQALSLGLDTQHKTPLYTSELEVTETDTDLLAAIWKDEGLGLYSTKWPVPTHLAHLAAKRAMLHLRKDDKGKAIMSSTLPPVHENVRDTLYYL
jgi:hypothetical protein